MREIKFRAWDRKTKTMFGGVNNISPREDYELMQFTGLKDKNGKEIYEGDVLRFLDKQIYEKVLFKNGMFVREWAEQENPLYLGLDHFEIIGNIWENPELLGKAAA